MNGHQAQAETLFRQALAHNPRHGLAASNLGMLLLEQHRYDEGWGWVQAGPQLRPDHPGVWVNLGNAYSVQYQHTQAIGAYAQALALDPRNPMAWRNQTRAQLESGDWAGIDAYLAQVRRLQRQGPAAHWADYVSPFDALFLPFSRRELFQIGQAESARYSAPSLPLRPLPPAGQRLRLGYVSSDFHDHPTMHLAGRLFELHDRTQFEVWGYNVGYPDSSAWRGRATQGCDHFVDAHRMGDAELAARVAADQIDVLVDLKGLTGGGRPGVLARACAPVQVNYLGFPGTTGIAPIGYLLADAVLVPQGHDADYSERVWRLPDTYQLTDDEQPIDPAMPSRAALGLPEDATVLGCFNNLSKVDRRSFCVWMRVLQGLPNSVMWLLATSDQAMQSLRQRAADAKINPERLVFAPVLPKAQHLARLPQMDLMLDTLTCNAHTTATDALYAGVPVVTVQGDTFASRVASSLLHAAGLPTLACTDDNAMVHLALSLGADPKRRTQLRNHLLDRRAHRLFATRQRVRQIEDAYQTIVDAHRRQATQPVGHGGSST